MQAARALARTGLSKGLLRPGLLNSRRSIGELPIWDTKGEVLKTVPQRGTPTYRLYDVKPIRYSFAKDDKHLQQLRELRKKHLNYYYEEDPMHEWKYPFGLWKPDDTVKWWELPLHKLLWVEWTRDGGYQWLIGFIFSFSVLGIGIWASLTEEDRINSKYWQDLLRREDEFWGSWNWNKKDQQKRTDVVYRLTHQGEQEHGHAAAH